MASLPSPPWATNVLPPSAELPEAIISNGSAPPDWIQDIRRKYTLRITDWVTQAWAVTHAPRRFVEDWGTGRRETLNPLRFFAVGTTVNFFSDKIGRRLLHIPKPPDDGWRAIFHTHLGVTMTILVFGAWLHLVLRFKSRAPIRSSLAATIFASAGPGTFSSLAGWVISGAIFLVRGSVPIGESGGVSWPWPLLVCAYLSFGWMVATLSAVHRVRWYWPVLGLLTLPIALTVLGAAVAAVLFVTGGAIPH